MASNKIETTNTTISSEEESSVDNKRASSTSPERGQDNHQPQQPAEVLKCPRCDSMKTKFCYYNNYSLTQPRHFCKTCRRYWTKGGALRNVPIGGGCRKSKKLKSSASNSSIDSSSASASLDLGGLKFLHGFSSSPAMDFQLGGLSLPRLNLNSPPSSGIVYNQFSNSFGDIVGSSAPLPATTCLSLDNPSLGFNFSFPPLFKHQSGNNVTFGGNGNQELGYAGNNLDFPWKFQEQKFVDLLSGNNNNINLNMNIAPQAPSPSFLENYQQIQRPQPILFQNFDIAPRTNGFSYGDNPRKEGPNGNFVSGYFLEETFAPTINQVQATSTVTSNGANKGNENGINWNNGVQAWDNLDQFGELR